MTSSIQIAIDDGAAVRPAGQRIRIEWVSALNMERTIREQMGGSQLGYVGNLSHPSLLKAYRPLSQLRLFLVISDGGHSTAVGKILVGAVRQIDWGPAILPWRTRDVYYGNYTS